jgi:type 1 fimbria pilin
MTFEKKAALAAMLLAVASTTAVAAETADLAVTGTIRPSACNVSLSDNGQVNYGTISGVNLNQSEVTRLPARNVTMTISCDAATQIGVRLSDSRPNTLATGLGLHAGYGLGTVNDTRIGGFQLTLEGPTLDGTRGNVLARVGTTWTAYASVTPGQGFVTSWAATGAATPGSYSNITVPVSIITAIAAKDNLPELAGGLALDGLATFTLVYL